MEKKTDLIIFLDIDGVLVTNRMLMYHDNWGHKFDPVCVENLRKLVTQTQAKIVISSAWRYRGLKFLQDMWKARNLPGEVIDITRRDSSGGRGHEIHHWLMAHRGLDDRKEFIIIDDDVSDIWMSQKKATVKTSMEKGFDKWALRDALNVAHEMRNAPDEKFDLDDITRAHVFQSTRQRNMVESHDSMGSSPIVGTEGLAYGSE